MRAALWAGAAYFGIVFALGFALGTVRVLAVARYLGEFGAVLIELPAMLAASWFACRWLVRACGVPPAFWPRAAMGAVAFALLIAAEFALGTLLFGRSLREQALDFGEPARVAGLAAQILFAAFPLLARRRPA